MNTSFIFWYTISSLSDVKSMLAIWIVVLLYLWIQKKYRYALFVLFTLVLGMSITFLLKHLIDIPRPESALILEKGSRFPSGHATIASLSAGILIAWIYIKRHISRTSYRILTILLIIWSFLVSYSRLFLGVHYSIDVLIGMSIGFGSVILTYHLFRHIEYHIKI
jgi:undecaprenyl-diphosphatase